MCEGWRVEGVEREGVERESVCVCMRRVNENAYGSSTGDARTQKTSSR